MGGFFLECLEKTKGLFSGVCFGNKGAGISMAAAELESVEFRYYDGTTVAFTHNNGQWLSWVGRVRRPEQEPVTYHGDFLRPTAKDAKQLVERTQLRELEMAKRKQAQPA